MKCCYYLRYFIVFFVIIHDFSWDFAICDWKRSQEYWCYRVSLRKNQGQFDLGLPIKVYL